MQKFNLKDFTRGWVYGNFEPTLMNSSDTEISIKKYNKDDHEQRHYHKVATEWTIIVEGAVEMNGERYYKDDIIKIYPNESTDFKCLTDVTTVVIKSPCVKDDKFSGYSEEDSIKEFRKQYEENPIEIDKAFTILKETLIEEQVEYIKKKLDGK